MLQESVPENVEADHSMSNTACPFDEGDRVDHKIFGFGVVNGAPIPVVGPDPIAVGGSRDAGWCVPVRWDDPERTAREVMDHALARCRSPKLVPSHIGTDSGNHCLRIGC
jgi:hypothetical protein